MVFSGSHPGSHVDPLARVCILAGAYMAPIPAPMAPTGAFFSTKGLRYLKYPAGKVCPCFTFVTLVTVFLLFIHLLICLSMKLSCNSRTLMYIACNVTKGLLQGAREDSQGNGPNYAHMSYQFRTTITPNNGGYQHLQWAFRE